MKQYTVIAALGILVLICLIFGITQNIDAKRQHELAVVSQSVAVAAQAEADRQKQLAQNAQIMANINAAEAEKQRARAEEALKNCKGRK